MELSVQTAFLTNDSKSGLLHTTENTEIRLTANVLGENNDLICLSFKGVGFDVGTTLLDRKRLGDYVSVDREG